MELKRFYPLAIILISQIGIVHMASFTEVNSLYSHLTTGTGRNKYLRPQTDQDQATDVMISFTLFFLLGIDEVGGSISVGGYFTVMWKDENLVWTPSSYNNIELITLPHDQIWKPPLINCNSVQDMDVFGSDNTYVRLYHNGTVMWLPGQNLFFTCEIDTTFFPFDQQDCTLDVIGWGFPMGKITFTATSDKINTDMYRSHSEWELTETSVTVSNTGNPMASFNLKYKRRSLFLFITLVLPASFLAVLNISVFFLPHDCGERIGFSITLLLAIVVFLTIAQALLPATAVPRLSAICIILLIDMMLSGMILASVIVSSWFYYRSEDKPIPGWLKKIVISKCLCCRKSPNKITDIHSGSYYGNEKAAISADSFIEAISSEDIKKAIPPKDARDATKEEAITWQRVAESWDSLNIAVYLILVVVGNLYFYLDVTVGNNPK